jgi:perosamine synthetase
MPTVVVDADVPFDRDKLLRQFKAHSIDGRVFFWPLSSLPMFSATSEGSIARALSVRAFNLPSYHDISEAELVRVESIVNRHFGGHE